MLSAAQAGQEWAVACFYEELATPVLRYLRWREPRLAEDLASDTWVSVAEGLHTFSGDEAAFRAWVFTIARRRLADARRRAARRKVDPVPPEALSEREGGGDPAEVVAGELSAKEAIAKIGALLPPVQAEIVALRVVAGLGVDEVAAIIGKRPGTVRVLQHRALAKLAASLSGDVFPGQGEQRRKV